MIILLDKRETEKKESLKRKFRRYSANILKTGLDECDLIDLIDIYLEPEFKADRELSGIEKGSYE